MWIAKISFRNHYIASQLIVTFFYFFGFEQSLLTNVFACSGDNKQVQSSLNKDHEKKLRNSIIGSAIGTAVPKSGPFKGFTVLLVPKETRTIYRKDRIKTLQILLDIIKNGKPDNALLAAGCAVALEHDIALGAGLVQYPPKWFDKNDNGDTARNRYIELTTKLIEKARKSAD